MENCCSFLARLQGACKIFPVKDARIWREAVRPPAAPVEPIGLSGSTLTGHSGSWNFLGEEFGLCLEA